MQQLFEGAKPKMWLHERIVDFFGIRGLLSLISQHQIGTASLLTLRAWEAVITPIFPALLLLEAVFLLSVNRRAGHRISAAYKVPVLMYIANFVIAALVNLDVFLWTQTTFSKFAPFTTDVRIRWFLYSYLIWELSHFVYHWTCHKVRLLWCLHSPHHAPHHMNLSVIFTAFFLQGAYATFVRTAICSLLGVPLPLLILCMVIDGCWGALIHVSEEVWPKGKIAGFLGRVILMPSDHRVHHANNPEYIDKNYCNTLPIWDRIFGTLQREIPGEKPEYGLSRDVKYNSFFDMYFGEIGLLVRDVRNAGSIKNAFLHVVMPPGWEPKSRNR
jgi:sterol desaturase/sphingolipid hydroxylase (fatty acid hydroxylase superfamily)